MSKRAWLHNARGEWFVVAQGMLVLAVGAAPKVEGRSLAWSWVTGGSGGLLCIIGLGLVVLGSLALGRNLSSFPKPKDGGTLTEHGIFSLVRHPIYSGFGLAALGWSLIWNSLWAFAATVVLWVFFDAKAGREEHWLEEKFDNYAAYKSRVKKLIPFIY
jgi:protein-S-isoprenylcysteine O-methyltransferase Ste14